MQNSVFEVNKETMEFLKQQIPDVKNPLKVMGTIVNIINSITLVVNDDLEFGVIRMKTKEESE